MVGKAGIGGPGSAMGAIIIEGKGIIAIAGTSAKGAGPWGCAAGSMKGMALIIGGNATGPEWGPAIWAQIGQAPGPA